MKKLLALAGFLSVAYCTFTLGQNSSPKGWGGASWVWDQPDAHQTVQSNDPRYLRRTFDLAGKTTQAELWITADNHYVVYVNGQKVGEDGEWNTVEKYDVAKHLKVGKNVLAIKATNQGGPAGVIARLYVKTADKKDLFIVTDQHTKITQTAAKDWLNADFDDAGWFAAIVLGDPSIGPWNIAGNSVGQIPGKGPNSYGSAAVDPKVQTRLSAQEQLKHFIVPKDFEIELVAADPVVINPITMVLDDKGRIIVSESHTYRYGPPGSPIKPFANPVIRLDPDGKGGFMRTLIADGFTDPVMGIAVKGNKLWLTACDYLYTYDLPPDGEAKGDKAKDARRPLDEKQKEQLKLQAFFADRSNEQRQRHFAAAFQINQLQTKHPKAIDGLLSLLGDEPDDVTVMVARALLESGDAKALSALEKLGTVPPNPVNADPQFPPDHLAARELVRIGRELAQIRGAAAARIKAKQKEAPTESKGIATNKKLLLKDHSKAWNPFGMFVLEWGPDGKLYMSVGNHNINIEGPDGKISARGGSGLVMRMNPDGTKMERLVHGLRVPYSFEYDPFGQLWLLSNGEGNPDRFVRVIDGVDYHCYSRGVDNNWLAGNHPLAPPCEEVHGGAHTQLMRYYAAAYPQEYQGNLFTCNWGRHGFAGPNRGIFRFVLDDRNNVVKKDTLVACTDPHFRPSHIHLDVDGSLLIADWYGRDDESDMTGRIWRLKYVGKDRPVVKHKLDAPEWKNDDYAIEALGSPDHMIRQKAVARWSKADKFEALRLQTLATQTKNPLAAANALWALSGIGTEEAKEAIVSGALNDDWRVRRLAIRLLRQIGISGGSVEKEQDPAVLLETALGQLTVTAKDLTTVVKANGTAADPHLRYEAAWHLAKHADDKSITSLLTSDDANIRLAGLIAIDVACFENFPTKKTALAALAKALENPGKLDHQLLLTVAQAGGDASIVPALEKLIAREDLPTATIAKAVLVLKAKAGGLSASKLSAAAGKRLIEAVEKGSLKIASPADQLVIFEFLESEGPTPFALKQIGSQLQSNNKELKLAAHTLARRFGAKASALADPLWPSVLNPKTKFDDAFEYLSTIARTEHESPKVSNWVKLLESDDSFIRAETVRWWRSFKGKANASGLLIVKAPELIKKDPAIGDDLVPVIRHLGMEELPIAQNLKLPTQEKDKDVLTKYALAELAKMPAADRPKRAAMGLQVFERNACTKCHTTATQTTLLAPSLKGVAAQKLDYLIESVLYPSKIIKTGWEVETVVTTDGKIHTGLVKDDGKMLRVLNQDKEVRVAKTEVESRTLSKTSIMPEGQEATLSRREFVDLISYLTTLK